ncbi:MAG: transcription antitermination factor NusB [Clostridia bacterium]
MTRTETRELAFELLYSLEIQKIPLTEYEEQIKLFLENKEIGIQKVETYITETANGIKKNEDKILKLISQNLKEKWDIKRISKVNLTLLKLAVYEIVYTKIPYKVVINEVVEIAKKYGDDNSSLFVNGILANIIKQLEIKNEE